MGGHLITSKRDCAHSYSCKRYWLTSVKINNDTGISVVQETLGRECQLFFNKHLVPLLSKSNKLHKTISEEMSPTLLAAKNIQTKIKTFCF